MWIFSHMFRRCPANQVPASLQAIAAGLLTSCAPPPQGATITRPQAAKFALQRVRHGKVHETELDKEHGRLVCSCDITRPGARNITEVTVDAQSGAVVAEEVETPAGQARERQRDAAAKAAAR